MSCEQTDALLHATLRERFGHSSFRPLQLEAIKSTLSGRDVLVICVTGGGKSVTFQLPVLTKEFAFTVVICPLIALSRDQVNGCLEKDIDAELWNCEATEQQRKRIESELQSDEPSLKLLYTTPESLRTPRLKNALKVGHENGCLFSFAIDEAHCVSSWGHDFRHAYLDLSTLRQEFKGVPFIALTATCTPDVQRSIIELLGLKDPVVTKGTFNRPNIGYEIRLKELIGNGSDEQVLENVVDYIKSQEGQHGIIYARLRATCDWLVSELVDRDIDACAFHAGKDSQLRNSVLNDFQEGSVHVVVATIAFGMGIDKPDIRWIVHWNAPASLEGYYQESGRAGRDGKPCKSILYVSQSDLEAVRKLEKGARKGSISEVANFAMQPRCRRRAILEYFEEKRGACQNGQELVCDFCTNRKAVSKSLATLEDIIIMRKEKELAKQARQQEDENSEMAEKSNSKNDQHEQNEQPCKSQRKLCQGTTQKAGAWEQASSLTGGASRGNCRESGSTVPQIKRRKLLHGQFKSPFTRTTSDNPTQANSKQGVGGCDEQVQSIDKGAGAINQGRSNSRLLRRPFCPPLNASQQNLKR